MASSKDAGWVYWCWINVLETLLFLVFFRYGTSSFDCWIEFSFGVAEILSFLDQTLKYNGVVLFLF